PDLFGGDVVADHDQVHSPGFVVQHGPYGARDRPCGGVHGDHHIDPRVIATGPAPHLVSPGPVLTRVIAPCPVIPGPLHPPRSGVPGGSAAFIAQTPAARAPLPA